MIAFQIIVFLWLIHMIFLNYLRFRIIRKEAAFDIKKRKILKKVNLKILIEGYRNNKIDDKHLYHLVRLYFYSRRIFYLLTFLVIITTIINSLIIN